MAFDAHKNLTFTLVEVAPSPATSGTSLTVTATEGAIFPTAPFSVTVWPSGVRPTRANAEIMRVTAVVGDVLTIDRAEESSVARTIVVGDNIAETITVKTLTDIEARTLDTVVASTDTGAQNNWAPGLVGHTIIVWNGASALSVTGIDGGVAGQRVTFKNITAAQVASFTHASGSSDADNRLNNYVSSAPTPVAANGSITYEHNGTDWKVIYHEQGAWITPTFDAAHFTCSVSTWTVEAADVAYMRYRLSGRTVHVNYIVQDTTIGAGAGSNLRISKLQWGNFTAAGACRGMAAMFNNGGGADGVSGLLVVGDVWISNFCSTSLATGWTAGTNNATVTGCMAFEVT